MIRPSQAIIKKRSFKLFNWTIFEFTNTQLKTVQETPQEVWKRLGTINQEFKQMFEDEIEEETQDKADKAIARMIKPAIG